MEIIPAIDLIGGQCVRLTKGDYNTQKVYGNPVDMARIYADHGFTRLHLVDLDGAKVGTIQNQRVLEAIASVTDMVIDYGGGIKTEDDLRKAFDCGAAMITIGSLAVKDEERFCQWIELYGSNRFILGADARDGKVSVSGWLEDSPLDLLPFIDKYMQRGLKSVLCTDINRDGMLQGPAIDLYKEIMLEQPLCHLIASGGVSCIEDVYKLDEAGIPAVVIGKAIFEGRIDLKELSAINK